MDIKALLHPIQQHPIHLPSPIMIPSPLPNPSPQIPLTPCMHKLNLPPDSISGKCLFVLSSILYSCHYLLAVTQARRRSS